MISNTQQVTLEEYTRPLEEFHKRLNGDNAREWLDAFKRFLRKEEPWIISSKWKNNIWTLARVGLKKPLQELITEIKKRGFKIHYSESYPFDLLELENDLQFNTIEEDIYFVAVSPKELGLKAGNWSKRQLLDVLKEQGLQPCLSGDILEILAQGAFELKREDKDFTIGMEPIIINKQPAIFCIAKYEYYHLGYYNGDLNQKYTHPDSANNKHIFRIRKKYML